MKRLIKARVLDLTDDSGVYCTKLLAALGADVIRVEPPGGDKTRRIGPFYHDEPHPERSLHWFLHNLNKRSITLNIEDADGRALFRRLVATSAVVVECFPPGYLDGIGLGYVKLREVDPRIVLTSITPFGQQGPYSDYKGNDAIASAMGGLMYQTGTTETPPLHASIPLVYTMTGLQAAVGTLLAYLHQRRTGKGQHVDVSQQQCAVWTQYPYHQSWKAMGVVPRRNNGNAPMIPGLSERKIYFQCLDGWVAAYPTYWSHMPIALQWMRENGFGDDIQRSGVEAYNAATGSAHAPGEITDAVNEIFARMAAKFTKRYLFEEGQSRGMQVAAISSMEDILNDRHLKARGHFVQIEHPELGEAITYPGPPFKLDPVDVGYHRRAPLIGEHNDEIYGRELGLSADELVRYRQANVI